MVEMIHDNEKNKIIHVASILVIGHHFMQSEQKNGTNKKWSNIKLVWYSELY